MSLASARSTMKSALITLWSPQFPAGATQEEKDLALETTENAAEDFLSALEEYIESAKATVTVPAGTFLTAATGGVPNPAPVTLTGEPDDGSGGLS